jgi:hypothetical protein
LCKVNRRQRSRGVFVAARALEGIAARSDVTAQIPGDPGDAADLLEMVEMRLNAPSIVTQSLFV